MSTHQDIAESVKEKIETLYMPPTVIIRDITRKEEGDKLPLIVITKGAQRSVGGGPNTEFREYEILITIMYAQNHRTDGGLDDAPDWRETIRQLLIPDTSFAGSAILTGVSSVYNVDAVDMPGQSAEEAMANYETSVLGLVYYTSEASHVAAA